MRKEIYLGLALALLASLSACQPSGEPLFDSTPEGGAPGGPGAAQLTPAGPGEQLPPDSAPSTTPPEGQGGELSEAQRVAQAFFEALEAGDAAGALALWSPNERNEAIQRMVAGWATGEHQFSFGAVTYGGLVAEGDYRTLEADDPRVDSATVEATIDGVPGGLGLEKVEGEWLIFGWMVSDPLVRSGPVYLSQGTIYNRLGESDHPVGVLPEDAGPLALGPGGLAYASEGQVYLLSLGDSRAPRPLWDFRGKPGLALDLEWSADGAALACAAAWDEPDGSRRAALGVSDLSQARLLAEFVARPAQAAPAAPPEPGYTGLEILGFEAAEGRLAVVPVGGQERYAALWLISAASGELQEEVPLNSRLGLPPDSSGIRAVSAARDLAWLALALPGEVQVWPLGSEGERAALSLPDGCHVQQMHWSPEARRLAYLVQQGESPGAEAAPATSLQVWSASSGESRPLLDLQGETAFLWGWDPQGHELVVERFAGEDSAIELVNAEMGSRQALALPPGSRLLGWFGVGSLLRP